LFLFYPQIYFEFIIFSIYKKNTLFFSLTNIFQEDSYMAEEQAPLPRRTLADFVMYQGPKQFSNIAIPATAKALEINPDFLSLINA